MTTSGERYPSHFHCSLHTTARDETDVRPTPAPGLLSGLTLMTRRGTYSPERLAAVASAALARLKDMYADSDETVTRYFPVETGAAL